MNDELAAIAGKYEELVGRLQESYGIAKDEARVRVNEFKKTVDQLKKSNAKLIALHMSLKKNARAGKKLKQVRKGARKKPSSRRSR